MFGKHNQIKLPICLCMHVCVCVCVCTEAAIIVGFALAVGVILALVLIIAGLVICVLKSKWKDTKLLGNKTTYTKQMHTIMFHSFIDDICCMYIDVHLCNLTPVNGIYTNVQILATVLIEETLI